MNDIYKDLRDGQKLLLLLEVLTSVRLVSIKYFLYVINCLLLGVHIVSCVHYWLVKVFVSTCIVHARSSLFCLCT